MKKRSIAARLGVTALALTLVTTSLSSGTLAKYTTTVSAKGELKVAKWNVGASMKNSDGSHTWALKSQTPLDTMNLFDTAYTTGDNAVKGNKVVSGFIAPGVSGEYIITVTTAGTSATVATNVDVDYKVYLKPTSGSTPKNFLMYDKAKGKTDAIDLADTSNMDSAQYGFELTSGTIKGGATGASAANKDLAIAWEWPYSYTSAEVAAKGKSSSALDSLDTMDGTNAPNAKWEVYVLLTQADPTAA